MSTSDGFITVSHKQKKASGRKSPSQNIAFKVKAPSNVKPSAPKTMTALSKSMSWAGRSELSNGSFFSILLVEPTGRETLILTHVSKNMILKFAPVAISKYLNTRYGVTTLRIPSNTANDLGINLLVTWMNALANSKEIFDLAVPTGIRDAIYLHQAMKAFCLFHEAWEMLPEIEKKFASGPLPFDLITEIWNEFAADSEVTYYMIKNVAHHRRSGTLLAPKQTKAFAEPEGNEELLQRIMFPGHFNELHAPRKETPQEFAARKQQQHVATTQARLDREARSQASRKARDE